MLRCNMSKEQDNDCTKKVILLMHAAVSKPLKQLEKIVSLQIHKRH